MNVPALSERTLQRDIEKGDFSSGPEVQGSMVACSKYTLHMLKASCLQQFTGNCILHVQLASLLSVLLL